MIDHMSALTPDADGSQRPLRADAERNRQLVLDAARQAFADHGLGVRLDEIAELAGVGVGTVYRRFKDKDALVAALFEEQIAGVIDLAEEALATCPDGTGLRWFLEHTADAMAEDRGLLQILTSPQATAEPLAEATRKRLEPLLSDLLRRAADAGQVRDGIVHDDMAIVLLVLSAVVDATAQARPGLRQRYARLILDALEPGAGRSLPGPKPNPDDIMAILQAWLPRPRRPGARG